MTAYRTPGERDSYVEEKAMTDAEATAVIFKVVFGVVLSISIPWAAASVANTWLLAHAPSPLDDCIAHGGTYDAKWSRCDPPKEGR